MADGEPDQQNRSVSTADPNLQIQRLRGEREREIERER